MTEALDLNLTNGENVRQLLQFTVETTRKVLNCTRVIVYSASELPQAVVLAESVDAKYASILGKVIQDPFLKDKYLEMYAYGLPVAINNLDQTDVSKNDLQNIEKLDIKSLAIAPISVNNKLWAFLVAHECSEVKLWSSDLLGFLAERANGTSFALSQMIISAESEDWDLTYQRTERTQLPTVESQKNGKDPENYQLTSQKSHLEENNKSLLIPIKDKIADEIEPEKILNTTVEALSELFQCDRVLVYSIDRDGYGVIMAEAVVPGCTKALAQITHHVYCTASSLEQYRQGKVKVWDNISDEIVTPCDLEQLEALAVKSAIVAPIIHQDQLWGLLVAHQCSHTRNWQQQEINWITQIANQVGSMLESNNIVSNNHQLESSPVNSSESQWNQNFTDAIQYIRQSLTREDVLKATVKEVRRILHCDRVVVYSMTEDERGLIVAESVAAGWVKAQGRVIDDPCFEAKYLAQYRNGRVRAWNNIYESGLTQCYIGQLEQLEVKANLVTPIINEGKLFGLLVAHQCSVPRQWQQPEILWLAQIATQVGFALDNAKLLADARKLQNQLANEAQLTKYFTDATRYIRESLAQEDILEVTVEEVRRVLHCDRVVVYSLNRDNYGVIVAESVAPGWTRAEGRVIKDPCFESKYLDKYRNGRVRAWSNIYEAGFTKCYIDQLEQIEVKANLVTPIINEGKLFGLLVAHQCSDSRDWQQSEIRWVTDIATQVGFALDNAKLLADAKKLRQQIQDESKWTEYFTDVIQHIRQSLKTADILKTSVREVRRILHCDRVVVYSMTQDERGMIVAESVGAGWIRSQGRVIDDPCFEAKYLNLYRNGRVRAWSDIYKSGLTSCYVEQLEQLEVKANLVAPIINEGKLFGLLVAHQCSHTREWLQSEIRWMSEIATQVGFALDNAKLLEQLEESSNKSNQISHEKYEQNETLKDQIVGILASNGDAYQTLSHEAMSQSEATIKVLHRIQEVADSFSAIALNIQQIKFQEQQQDLALQNTQESLARAINTIMNLERTSQNMTIRFEHLSNSCQQLSETVTTIKDLSKQMVRESMNIARTLNRNQINEDNQNSLIDLSDTIFSLMQQLFEAIAKLDPLFASITAEVREKTITLDSETKQLTSGVGEFQIVSQRLERVTSLNDKISPLMENITNSVENQILSSTFAKDSVQEVASIAERISEQSMAITQSFNQLVALIQKL